jgi:hypothetical protein
MAEQQPQQSYDDGLKRDFSLLIDALEISELGKRFLRLRWLDQMLWAERRAGEARNRYYGLRLVAIVGGVIVPALVGLQLGPDSAKAMSWIILVISLTVAVSLAVESFFRWGERWTHYRRMSELLKSEGWLFFQLAPPYLGTHADAYPAFAGRVEAIVATDVDSFIAQVAREKGKSGESDAPGKS